MSSPPFPPSKCSINPLLHIFWVRPAQLLHHQHCQPQPAKPCFHTPSGYPFPISFLYPSYSVPLTCLYPANSQPISRAYCFLIGSLLPAYCELIVSLLKAYLELIGELIETCWSLLGELIETRVFPIKNSHKRRFNLWGTKVMICFHSCNTSERKTIIFLHFQCIFLFSVRQQYDIYRRYARERYDNSTTYSRENVFKTCLRKIHEIPFLPSSWMCPLSSPRSHEAPWCSWVQALPPSCAPIPAQDDKK